MAFDWDKYRTLADDLYDMGLYDNNGNPLSVPEEECLRSFVSRAYYCIFNLLKLKFGIIDNTPDVHRLVVTEFESNFGPKEASTLERLRGDRNICDYKEQQNINKHFAERFKIRFDYFISFCQSKGLV